MMMIHRRRPDASAPVGDGGSCQGDNMKKNDVSFDPEKYSVLIPYSDLEKFISLAHEMHEMKFMYRRLEEKYSAMMSLYSEILEKVAEMEKYL